MKTKCINYNDCRRPVQKCNNKCEIADKTCTDCKIRIGEECGLDGHEVYDCSVPCYEFVDIDEYAELHSGIKVRIGDMVCFIKSDGEECCAEIKKYNGNLFFWNNKFKPSDYKSALLIKRKEK